MTDPSLDYYAQQAQEIEVELVGLAAELELQKAVESICKHPEWNKFVERLTTLKVNIAEKILRANMSPYELGKRQGIIAAIQAVLGTSGLTQPEVDARHERITMLSEKLDDLRKLLE